MSTEEVILCENLIVGYGGRALLPPINLAIRRREFWAVVGRNGSGKTTWLRTALGVQRAVSGRASRTIGGDRFAYVAQAGDLDPLLPLRVRDVVLWGRLRGFGFLGPIASREDRRRCEEALEHAEASDLVDRRYSELSVGQKQRVLFARMLATDADCVFLDEPTAAMDMVAERDVMEKLRHLASHHNRAVVLVTHYLSLVAKYADKVLFVDASQQSALAGDTEAVMTSQQFCDRFGRFDHHDA